jgi:hypothetical protein
LVLLIELVEQPLDVVPLTDLRWLHDAIDYVVAAMNGTVLFPDIPVGSIMVRVPVAAV